MDAPTLRLAKAVERLADAVASLAQAVLAMPAPRVHDQPPSPMPWPWPMTIGDAAIAVRGGHPALPFGTILGCAEGVPPSAKSDPPHTRFHVDARVPSYVGASLSTPTPEVSSPVHEDTIVSELALEPPSLANIDWDSVNAAVHEWQRTSQVNG